jgi:hypothetical protein
MFQQAASKRGPREYLDERWDGKDWVQVALLARELARYSDIPRFDDDLKRDGSRKQG